MGLVKPQLSALQGKRISLSTAGAQFTRFTGTQAQILTLTRLPGMSGKNVALALNSVSHRQGFDDLYAAVRGVYEADST